MILAIIPARGGSKGIPRKNVKMCAGKPLIAWTLERANESRLIDKVAVSTDDDVIRNIAREYYADIITRPPELADDHVLTMPVLQHALTFYPSAEIVVLLQCTSPVRNPGLIDQCIKEFVVRNWDSLTTGRMREPLQFWGEEKVQRQALIPKFWDDGNIYIMKASLVREGKYRGENNCKWLLDERQGVDIDTPFDFWVAEKILEER
jgi:CMP-N-acetylneuraminic acid synthetase